MADERKLKTGLQFKVLTALAVLFTLFMFAALAWGLTFVHDHSTNDAKERAIALSDQMDAVWDYVDENQPATNAYVQQFGDLARGLVCVTSVKSIARDFNKGNTDEIRVVALEPRNKEDSPDDFEREALEALAADESLEEYSGIGTNENGDQVYYYLRPRRVTESCLSCHGAPAGETDVLGYKKEGYSVGMVKGAVSVRESIGGYRDTAAAGAVEGIGLYLLGLLVVMGAMYALLRATVIKPVEKVSAAASAYRPGEGSKRIEQAGGTDELAELARDFNAMADDLDGLYADLGQRVEERTAQLERMNGQLQDKQEELESALSKLQSETEYKSRLFASLSHDLRTPLASIIALTQLAETQVTSDSQELESDMPNRDKEALGSIGDQARTLVGMVDNILAFSRAESSGIELHLSAIDLVDLASHVRSTMQPIAIRRGLELDVKVDADLPLVEADQNLLLRVLHNLVTNALKFTPPGGHVWVSICCGGAAGDGNAEADDGTEGTGAADGTDGSGAATRGSKEPEEHAELVTVAFVVEDDGVGVATEDLENVFEPYTKGPYREGGSQAGAGLGLAVIRQIADVMQGEAKAEQRAGGGSRFTFSFPAAVLDEEEYE